MSYSKVNLKDDVQDSATRFGYAPDMEARFAGDALGLEHSGMGYERFSPNFRVPFGHAHKGQEELYVIASGGGRLKLDDEIIEVRQWDAIRVGPGVVRNFEAGPDGLEVVAFGAPKMENPAEDADMRPGWWSD